MPPEAELNRLYSNLLEALAIPESKREVMMQQPAEAKWRLICANKSYEKQKDPNDQTAIRETVSRLAQTAPASLTIQQAQSLRVQLSGSNKDTLSKFFEEGLVVAVCGHITGVAKAGHESVQAVLVQCVHAIMNTQFGLESFLAVPDAASQLTTAMTLHDEELAVQVLRLLTVCTVFSQDGFSQVLEGFALYRAVKKESLRFQSLVMVLASPHASLMLKSVVITFINSLINAGFYLEDRIAIRADFVHLGLLHVMEQLRSEFAREGSVACDSSDCISTQINVFHAFVAMDNEEVLRNGVDLSNCEEVFSMVHNCAAQQGLTPQLLSLLHLLLALPQQPVHAKMVLETACDTLQALITGTVSEDGARARISDLRQRLDHIDNTAAMQQQLHTLNTRVGSQDQQIHNARVANDKLTRRCADITAQYQAVSAQVSTLQAAHVNAMATAVASAEAQTTALSAEVTSLRTALASVTARANAAESRVAVAEATAAAAAAAATAAPAKATASGDGAAASGGEAGAGAAAAATDGAAAAAAIEVAALRARVSQLESQLATATTATANAAAAAAAAATAGTATAAAAAAASTAAAAAAPIPTPPPLPGSVAIPTPPPLPGTASIPTPPPLPGTAGAGAAAAAGGVDSRGIPIPPPLPGTAGAGGGGGSGGFVRGQLDSRGIPIPPPLPGTAAASGGGRGGGGGGGRMPMGAMLAAARMGGGKPAGRPKKVSKKPPKPMKGLFWAKIPDNKVEGTLWTSLTDDGVNIDESALLTLFGKKAAAPRRKPAAAASSSSSSAPAAAASGAGKRKKKVSLLDPKRQQNAGIALARMRMPPAAVKAAVLSCDPDILTADKIGALIKVAPTAEEVAMVNDYDGDASSLGAVEQFFLVIQTVPAFGPRMSCMRIRLSFAEAAAELQTQVAAVSNAVDQVKNSPKLRRLLQLVLRVGNYINGGTNRGGAYGFQFDTLIKLATVKSSDNKRTLLEYVYQQAAEHYPEVLDLSSDLSAVPDATRLTLSQLTADLNTLKKDCRLVATQLTAARTRAESKSGEGAESGTRDAFADVMGPFAESAEKQLQSLILAMEHLDADASALTRSFGEPKSTDCQTFLTKVNTFTQKFDAVREVVARRKKAEERAKKQAAAAAARGGRKPQPSGASLAAAVAGRAAARGSGGDGSGGGENKGLVDNLLATQTGDLNSILANVRQQRNKRGGARAPPGGGGSSGGMMGGELAAALARRGRK